eukprot:3975500-Prorocentrum_lima.AAC.1
MTPAIGTDGDDVVVLVHCAPVDRVVVGHNRVISRVDHEGGHFDSVHAKPDWGERVQRSRRQRVDTVVLIVEGGPPILVAAIDVMEKGLALGVTRGVGDLGALPGSVLAGGRHTRESPHERARRGPAEASIFWATCELRKQSQMPV